MQARPAHKSEDERIGMVLQERYRIVRRLGGGGMGAVYEGEHLLIGKRVAIKILHAQFAQDAEMVTRFVREAKAATAIGHPNIVEVNDMGQLPDKTAYMVLEYLDGRDFATDIRDQGPQPLGNVVHIVSQVCDALSAAHAKGIIHRDLKPENIFLVERGGDPNFAKVVDFGISKITDSADEHVLTRTGNAIGTPYFMAPEQCQGKKDLDARADIYALGVILFQALTRQYPFADESYPMLVVKICTERPPPLAEYRTDLPPQLEAIMQRMLAKLPQNRFENCAQVRAALEPFRHLNDQPIIVSNAPSTAARAPSVLAGFETGPTMTPAELQRISQSVVSQSASTDPTPREAKSRKPLLWMAAAFLLFAALAGGGAVFALGLLDRNETISEPTRDIASPAPPPVEPVQPVPVVPAPPPVAPPTVVPPAPVTVNVHIEVRDATTAVQVDTAQISIDGIPRGSSSFDVPRELQVTGQAPQIHTVQVQAPGYRTETRSITFLEPVQLTIPLQREGSRPTVRHSTPVVRPAPVFSPQPYGGAPQQGHSDLAGRRF